MADEETQTPLGKQFWQQKEKGKIKSNEWKTGNLDADWSSAKSTKKGKAYFNQLDAEVTNLEAKMAKMLKKFEKQNPAYKVGYILDQSLN